MFFIVKFEHHYNNDEEWYWEYKVLIKTLYQSSIEDYLKIKYPEGYIHITSIEEFHLNDGEIFDITPGSGPIG